MPAHPASPHTAGPLAKDANLVRYDEFIDAQIRSTRWMVKLVDLASGLVTLAAGVLAFLLAFALVEHWLVPRGFSTAARFVFFAALVGGIGYFAYRRLWPLVRRAINPVYAAKTIELASPTLKNTLVNLLLFRQRRGDVSDAVYRTLEEQAAQRLTRVPVDSAVDRSQLIRLGYVLVAIVAVAAIYKIASPKDPVIAAERVLMPWADIVPASRVKISSVTPGHITVARGEFVDIAAEVRGIGENESVVLRYTTADGQAVGKAVPMSAAADGFKFALRLPASSEPAGIVGLSQNLTYRVEAGDARSHDFDVTVISAPSILVDRIDYEYPKYTGEPNRTVTGTGDIRAIEGTRVTIHARANGPIDESFIDFDSDGRRDLRLVHQGENGKVSFVLALREDRQTPQYRSYALRFTNAEGRENKNPARFPITVLRDFDPEIRLVAPREKTLDVRLDETVTIEVDARDPDFALSQVRLRGEAVGRREINVQLMNEPHIGQFTGRYQFTPRDQQLRAGDIVAYWAEASDNRAPTANVAKTERQTIRIIAPDRPQPPPPGERNPGQRGDRGQRRPDAGQQKQDDPRRDQGDNAQQQGESSAGESPNDNGGKQSGQNDNERPSPDDSNSEEQKSDPTGGRRGARGMSGSGGADSEQKQSSNEEPGQKGQGGQPQDAKSANGTNSNDANSDNRGEGSRGGRDSRGGRRGDPARGGNSSGGRRGAGEQSADESKNEPSPVSSDGDNDSEAIQRIRERLQRNNELPKEDNSHEQSGDASASKSDNQRPSSSQDSQNSNSNQDGSKESDSSKGASQPPSENRNGQPSRGGRDASTKEPPGRGDRAGQDQKTRDQGSKNDPQGTEREQTPSAKNNDEKNDGAPGRREPNSSGDENPDLKGDQKDSVANRQVKRDGTGETGQSESADEGAGESTERGAGNDSKSAGRDVQSAEKTGQPGESTPGRGSTRRESPSGESKGGDDTGKRGAGQRGGDEKTAPDSGEDAGESPAGKAADGKTPDGKSADGKQGGEKAAGNSGEPQSGDSNSVPGEPGDSTRGQRGRGPLSPNTEPSSAASAPGGETGPAAGGQPNAVGNVPDADAANLDYARRQTDLVLERLSDQLNKKQVDPELLKDLGWTEDDLRKFVSRWQQRKEAARGNNPTAEGARKELDDALRSLGLRSTQPRQSQARDDQQRDLRSGYRGTIPLEYQERLRAYNRGVSRSQQESK